MPDSEQTHTSLDRIALTTGAQDLILDYSDPDQGGSRLRFRYVISRTDMPRLVTGYGSDIGYVGEQIRYDQIPHDVLGHACEWLRANAWVAHENQKETIEPILLEYLSLLERGRCRSDSSSTQQAFKW